MPPDRAPGWAVPLPMPLSYNQRVDAQSATPTSSGIVADLIAVIVAVTDDRPRVLTLSGEALPAGPFTSGHRSLQAGVRSWVERQTHHPLGYVEQLYTFADSDRLPSGPQQHVISVSYLGLTREEAAPSPARWRGWYDYFPWEDHRDGSGAAAAAALQARLATWATAESGARRRERQRRAAINFGTASAWNEELVLQRYELLHEAGLVPESGAFVGPAMGRPMVHDHRRILATGIARLRAKIKYRPVVFELMPDAFTLLQLQRTMEAVAGRLLHKPNFRRLIEQQALVEETGGVINSTGGRPAKLFRFRRDVMLERSAAGTKLPLARTP